MSTSPKQARMAFAGFFIIGVGIALNVLYLQDRSVASAAERAKLERAQARAAADRNRRLAVETKAPRETSETVEQLAARQAPAKAAVVRPIIIPEAPPARVGRFASPASVKPTPVAPPEPEIDRSQDTIRTLQQRLAALGYEPGAANGVPGLTTRAAIMAYEHDQGLPMTGEPSEPLLRHIENAPGAREAAVRPARLTRAPHAEQVLRTVQQSLAGLGYFSAKIDGRPSEETERAIREFEMDQGLVPTGRVSAPLLLKLARSSSAYRPAAAKAPAR